MFNWFLSLFKKKQIIKPKVKLKLSPVDEAISYTELIDINLDIKWQNSIYNIYSFETYFKTIVFYNKFLSILFNYLDEGKNISPLVHNITKVNILLPDFFLDQNRNYVDNTKELIEFKNKCLQFLNLYKSKSKNEINLSTIDSSNLRKSSYIVSDILTVSTILANISLSKFI